MSFISPWSFSFLVVGLFNTDLWNCLRKLSISFCSHFSSHLMELGWSQASRSELKAEMTHLTCDCIKNAQSVAKSILSLGFDLIKIISERFDFICSLNLVNCGILALMIVFIDGRVWKIILKLQQWFWFSLITCWVFAQLKSFLES